MQGDPEIIDLLNEALSVELTAINQYFLHARIYKNWGYTALGQHEYKESIEEMQHADLLIERILFLDGLPRMQHLEKLFIGGSVPECLDSDLELERRGRAHYVDAIARCETARDFVSRDILQKILSDTEEHIDYLETQRRLIEETGLSNYLQTAMGGIAS